MAGLTDEQLLAAGCIDRHALVSAGAGSGKTSVLVSRFLNILEEDPDCKVSDIVAVTFTNKAADEMRSRLKGELRKRLAQCAGSGGKNDEGRWRQVLSRIDQARIGTIHSLCESILRSMPAEAGVDPQFAVLDELERAQLLEECIEEELRFALARPEEHMCALMETPVSDVADWLKRIAAKQRAYRNARSYCGDLSVQDMQQVFSRLRARAARMALAELASDRLLKQGLAYLNLHDTDHEKLSRQRREVLALGSRIAAPLSSHAGDDEIEERMRAIEALAETTLLRHKAQGAQEQRDAIKAVREAARRFAKDVPASPGHLDEQAWLRLKALVEVADRTLSRFEKAKRERQRLDFDDLIESAHWLLTSCPETAVRSGIHAGEDCGRPGGCNPPLQNVRGFSDSTLTGGSAGAKRRYRANLRAILVDEFQDTNTIQAELLEALAGDSGKLFLIGDDKQSIYRFQGADVSVFNAWKEKISAAPRNGVLLSLTQCFRSHPSIVHFVNAVFEEHFERGDNGAHHTARHQALAASRKESPEPGRIQVFLLERREAAFAETAGMGRLEGDAVAAWILERVNERAPVRDRSGNEVRPIRFSDFGVLVQRNADFQDIEAALSAAGIPYITVAGAGLLERQEVYDLENLLRWLHLRADSHALLGVLRSPMFGITDDIIHRVAAGGGSLWSSINRAREADHGAWSDLERPVSVLRRLSYLSGRARLGELVRACVRLTGFDITLSAMPNGRQRARNLLKFIHLAERNAALSLPAFLDMLESMRALDVKQGDAPLAADDAVRLMTIHKSKGLEFGAVVLPVMGRNVLSSADRLLFVEEGGICLDFKPPGSEERSGLFTLARTIEKQFESAEKKRLLYVAMTRARDYLAMFMERSPRVEPVSFRRWLKETLGIDSNGDDPSGIRILAAEEKDAAFTLRSLDERSGAEWLEYERKRYRLSVPGHGQAAPAVSVLLLDPLSEPDRDAPGVPFEHLLRVTGARESPHPVVVGNFFHKVMQQLPPDLSRPSRDQLRQLGGQIFACEQKEEMVREVEQLLNLFFSSELHSLMKAARRRLHETSCLVPSKAGSFTEKRPDLLIEDAAGDWHIIDYKTDHVDALALDEHNRRHAPQINEYVALIEAATGICCRGWIYYAFHGLLKPVEQVAMPVSPAR